MSGLQRFEQRLESIVSGTFARLFRSAVQPVEISAALQRECDNNSQILARDRRLVPNAFHVDLSQPDMDRLKPFDTALVDELTSQLHEHAEQQGYVFPGPITVEFETATDLTTGRFRIRSSARAEVKGDATDTRLTRATAVLEVNGTRHPLDSDTVVGRGTDADLRINDPGVSRRHVQFRVKPGPIPQIEVHDLGSTNGMLVDGVRVPLGRVTDGTEVKIGNTVMTVRIEEVQIGGGHV